MKTLLNIFMMCLLSLPAWADRGEQKQVFGQFEVHYIGLTTSFLTPEVPAPMASSAPAKWAC